jgi:hypothetical protein
MRSLEVGGSALLREVFLAGLELLRMHSIISSNAINSYEERSPVVSGIRMSGTLSGASRRMLLLSSTLSLPRDD